MRKRLAILTLLVTVALAVGCSAADPYTEPLYTKSDVHIGGKVYVKGVVNPWESLGLPDQAGHSGEYLSTDGALAAWAVVAGGGDMLIATYDPAGKSAQVIVEGDARLTDARTPLAHNQDANTITTGTLDGDRLPAMSETKKGAVPATGVPSGLFLKDDGTWAAGGGYTDEQAQDAVGTILTDTVTVDFTYNDGGNQITADLVAEGVQDLVGAMTGGAETGIAVTYDDVTGMIDYVVSITQYTDEQAQDTTSGMIQNGTGITWSYDDVLNTLTPTVTNDHAHANKSTLDNIQEAFTTALKNAYDNAVSLAHSHANMATLNATQEAFTTALKTSYDWLVTNITSAWKTTVDGHIASTSNPHSVTKAQVGLTNVTDDAQEKAANKDASGGYAGLTLLKINFKNVLGTFTSFFTNSNTDARTYTFQNRDGTIADDTDLTGKVSHSLATAANDFLVASGAGTWAKQTLAQVKATLGLGTAAYTASTDYQAVTGKDATGGYAGLTLFKINFKNAANTITSWFTNSNTVARTYTFQDRDGTIADNTDITAQIPDAIGTAKGDLIGFSASGTPVNVPYSAVNNNVLTVDTTTASGWKSAAPAGGNDPRISVDAVAAGEQHDVTASTALTKVTVIDIPLTAGTYVFRYDVIFRSNQLTEGIRLAVSYSGTNGAFVWNWRGADLSALASTAAADQDSILATGDVQWNFASRAKSATTRGTTISVDTINADMYAVIEGVFVATGAGNLELWHGNETATVAYTTSVMVGTSVVVTKTK